MFTALLERLARGLDDARIDYMITGGQALLRYGEPRLTKDIDLTLDAGLDRLDEVLDAVRALDLAPLVDPATFTRETTVLPCHDESSGIRVDFVLTTSPYEREALRRSVETKIGCTEVRFASVEDLLVQKIIAGRPRDLEDVRTVLLKNTEVDAAYVERWLGEIGRALDEPLVRRFREARHASR